ncbi:MAG: hypothetical protein ACFFC3_14060 [Candidatus Odinarchaeota archaeon]
MKYKNYSGNKKTTFSISISQSIKDYLERYRRSIFKKLKDERFKNVSVFISNILEKCVKFFSQGNGLDELDKIINTPKKEVTDFFNDLLVGVNPYHFEESIKFDKYRPLGKLYFNTFAIYRNFVYNTLNGENDSNENIVKVLNLIGSFLLKNKLTERFDVYLQQDNIIMEYRGFFSNIHYNYSKGLAGVLGYFGIKLIDFYYEDKYTRFVFKKTPLLKDPKFSLKERKALSLYNSNTFISLDQILNNEKIYLWMDISEKNDSVVGIKDYISGKKIIASYLSKLENINNQENFDKKAFLKENILKMLSSFNWIILKDINNLDFIFNIKEKDHPIEFRILKEILDKYQML